MIFFQKTRKQNVDFTSSMKARATHTTVERNKSLAALMTRENLWLTLDKSHDIVSYRL